MASVGSRTVNEIIQDLAIGHNVSVERLKSSEVKRLLDVLADADAVILQELDARMGRLSTAEAQLLGFGQYSSERLKALRAALDQIASEAYEILYGALTATMGAAGKAEIAYQAGAITSLGVNVEWVRPSNTLVKTLVRARPFDGLLLKEHVKRYSEGKQLRALAAIRTAILTGQPTREAVKSVERVFDNSKLGAERITRTSIAHAMNASAQASFEANSDIIRGVAWDATLDSRVCPRCLPLDGRVFPLNGGLRPPLHILCRCFVRPVLKYRLSLPDGMRATMDGAIPASTTAGAWLKTKSRGVQDDILGPTRAALFRKGKYKLDDFIDKSGRLFTLDDLYKRDAQAFGDLGLKV